MDTLAGVRVSESGSEWIHYRALGLGLAREVGVD